MSKALAIKYRPTDFADVVEQTAVMQILKNQIDTNTIKHGYLFAGGAGTGKTTSARIFASMINNGKGTPIELDAASNNSVDDIRRLTDDAQTQSIDSEYKVFIIDECHSLSNQAWQAFLKTLEEPPAKSIFIMCTTNPEKIPQTILSRVQRYNFQRISFEGITARLFYILNEELNERDITWADEAVDYIAKIADGGMRDAITLMDKCLSYSNQLTMSNVLKALSVADYDVMQSLTSAICESFSAEVIKIVNQVFSSGVDLKLFIKNYFEYILDLNIYDITHDVSLIKIPEMYIIHFTKESAVKIEGLLARLLEIQTDIKWEQNPKAIILAHLLMFNAYGTAI